MPSGVDSAWCRVRPARATPNEAVPLPTWAGKVARPGSTSRSADRAHSGEWIGSALFPARHLSSPRFIHARDLITWYRLDAMACAKKRHMPCADDRVSSKYGFAPL